MLFKRAKLQPVLAFHWLELLRWTCTSPPPPLPHLLRPRPTLLPCRCLRMSPRFIPTSQDRVFETPTNLRSSPNVIIPPLLKNICVRVFFSQLTFWTSAYCNLQWCFEEQRRRSTVLTYSLSLGADSKQQVCYTSHPTGTLHFFSQGLNWLEDPVCN